MMSVLSSVLCEGDAQMWDSLVFLKSCQLLLDISLQSIYEIYNVSKTYLDTNLYTVLRYHPRIISGAHFTIIV